MARAVAIQFRLLENAVRMNPHESMNLTGASYAGIVKVVASVFGAESRVFRPHPGTISKANLEIMKKGAKAVKKAKRDEEQRARDEYQRVREEMMSSRNQALAISYGRRFSDDGVEESRAITLPPKLDPP